MELLQQTTQGSPMELPTANYSRSTLRATYSKLLVFTRGAPYSKLLNVHLRSYLQQIT
jgi:hypothetical protein